MASVVAKPCSNSSSSSSHVSPVTMVQENGSRNKRKFRADPPPLTDQNKTSSPSHNECLGYEFSAENFANHEHFNGCDMCSFSHENIDPVELDLGLSCSVSVGTSEAGHNHNRAEIEPSDEFHDADWSDLTESQLEELVLANLDTIFKSAINKIVSFGYTKEVATDAVLRSGLCYGCKDAVSNIVNNTLVFLRNGQEVDSSREHHFEDLQQMEKYILAELVCVVREVRPFFSTGDAMWCLLVSDMNVSHACTMDSESLSSSSSSSSSSIVGDVSDPNPIETQPRKEVNSTESQNPPCKPNHSSLCPHKSPSEPQPPVMTSCGHNSTSSPPVKPEVPQMKPKTPFVLNRFASEKENHVSKCKSFSPSSQNHEEKFVSGRKITGINKRESILRQKSVHLEKSYRTYGSKGSSRTGKLTNFGGLLLDKKLKSVSESTGINLKNLSLKINKGVGVAVNPPQENLPDNGPTQIGAPSSSDFNTETSGNSNPPTLPKTNNTHNNPPPVLLVASETELSLSNPPKQKDVHVSSIPSFDKWISHAKKDETIMKLVPRVHELQNQLQEWTEWANQKVMQAARRLGKDKAELKTLKLEKEEVERLKKEKQTLEENTMKKLSEMENALCKASGQVERANSAVRRLKVENSNLRHEMEAANLRAAESAASWEEVSKREKKTLMQFQSWEKLKSLIQEELIAEKRKFTQLQQDLQVAKEQQDQLESRWKQEEKAKEELVREANSYRIGRLEAESSSKLRNELTRLKADKNLQKYKEDIEKLQKEISMLNLKSDSVKIAALRGGVDGSYSSKLTEIKTSNSQQESHTRTLYTSKMMNNNSHGIGNGGGVGVGVKRERECVMCLSEEMSVVFLPCAHQVVCTTCNELHEKQGMKECPSCRGAIQRRICVRYARS